MHPQREAMIHIFFMKELHQRFLMFQKIKSWILKPESRSELWVWIAMFLNAGIPVHIIDQDEETRKEVFLLSKKTTILWLIKEG